MLILCPLAGYGFVQAVSLYGEASAAVRQSPVLAARLSPLDGILVPTFGSFYVAVTLLFPFVAIRVLSREKETGTLGLLMQLPYATPTLIATKLLAVMAAWGIASVPVVTSLAIWKMSAGHLYAPETLNLLFGHALYGLLVGAIAVFAAAISEGAATAAIIALAFTIGSWVLDFTAAGRPGLLDWVSRLSLTQTLRAFEQGLLSAGLVIGIVTAIAGFAALAAIWLPPGMSPRGKWLRSLVCVVATAAMLVAATQVRWSIDVTEDRRNSFPLADERALPQLGAPLVVTVHFAPEDPRYADLRRNVLSKLERLLPDITIRLAGEQQSVIGNAGDDAYGEVEYVYAGRAATTRSISQREILTLLYGLAGTPPPPPVPGDGYAGYPLVANVEAALSWFFGALPLSVAILWWWSRRPPRITFSLDRNGGQP